MKTMKIDCTDEKQSVKEFRTPAEAVEWVVKREREGKPPVQFHVNGKAISIRRLKQIAGQPAQDEDEPEEDQTE
jgi:hypothetical protein